MMRFCMTWTSYVAQVAQLCTTDNNEELDIEKRWIAFAIFIGDVLNADGGFKS